MALNRAVAVSFADGPAVALPLLDELATDPRLARSHRLALARAEIAARAGALDTARAHLSVPLDPATTTPEQAHIRRRMEALTS